MLPTGTAAVTDESRKTLPTGTITFLFTDIEGSTPLWEQHPQEMAASLQIHNTALRQVIEANGGAVFKTMGDAFQAAFPTAPQALKAAIEGQRALQAAAWNELGPLKVRMGLHTGEAELDPDGDEYAVSHAKNRIGRIHSAAHGGQILLSQETADLVAHKLPEGVSLKDLGEHHLKGMQWPERLFQVCAPGLLQDFPPLATAITRPNNLPLQMTSFIGREKEITAICGLLADHRLVTLTGVGGVGKTRLALAVAEQVLGEFEGGAWLAELAPLGDPQFIPQAVATVFNLRPDSNRPVLEALLDYLRAKRLLLILDNCEHLIGACAELAETILRSCPRVHLLASSREALGIAGEIPCTVPSLTLPDPRSLPPLHSLPEYEAVQLFLDRAQAAAPGFAINTANAAGLVRICQRVDGIPLALELAAARLQVLSVEQIASRLEEDFRLLTGGSRRALPRHQTLQALIGWSYGLLTDEEKAVFRRLSVFSGGWTLVAAEAVCSNSSAGASPAASAAEAVCERDVLDVLAQLVNKSLVVVQRQSGEAVRYRMLETIRQYAQERLTEAGEAPAVRDCHLNFYLQLAESSGNRLLTYEGLTGREKLACLVRLRTELDNLRGALGWSLGGEPGVRAEKGLRMASALDYLWFIDGHAVEGRDWLEKGLAMLEMDRPQSLALRAKAVFAIGVIGMFYGDKDARKMFEESMALFQQVGDVLWYTIAEEGLGDLLIGVDPPLALSYLEDAIAKYRQLGKTGLLAEALCLKGVLFVRIQDDEKGRKNLEAGVALCQEVDDPVDAGFWQGYLGDIAIRRGDFDRARFHAEERLRWSSDRMGMGWALGGLGRIARLQKDYVQMEGMFQKEYQISTDLGKKDEMQNCFWLIGVAALGQGDYHRAARIFVEFAPMARLADDKLGLLACLTAWAGVALGLGQPARAAQCLAAVDARLDEVQKKLHPDDQLDYDRYLDACRSQLEAPAFEAAWAQGRLLTLDQALEEAQAFCSQEPVEKAKGV